MQYHNKQINNCQGFTILEMVIVASVILIGIIGVLALVERTLKLRSINEKYLIGVQLAQEGIELARYLRNDNWMAITDPTQSEAADFDEDLNDSNGVDDNEKLFAIDYRARAVLNNRLAEANNGTEDDNYRFHYVKDTIGSNIFVPSEFDEELKTEETRLYIKEIGGKKFYIISDGMGNVGQTATPFHRLIKTIYHANSASAEDDYLEIISKVYWEDRGNDYYYGVATFLYDYDQYF